jgi:hypothetical protein
MRRIWIGVYVAAFGVFAALVMLHNVVQGVALAALGAVILGVALLYETAQRRG